MDDNERKAIIAESHATVERLSGLKVTPPRDPFHEDALERWARQCPQPEPPRQREFTAAEVQRQWQRYIDGRIDAALAPLREAVGILIASERRKHRNELDKIKAALQLQIDALMHELTKQRAMDAGSIIELPPMPLRRQRHAA